jgi:hypothetical protein
MMIEHHEQAIAVSKAQIQNGTDPEVKRRRMRSSLRAKMTLLISRSGNHSTALRIADANH